MSNLQTCGKSNWNLLTAFACALLLSTSFAGTLGAQESLPELAKFVERFQQLSESDYPVGIPDSTDELDSAVVELGRELFFEKGLSKDQTVSCASCHQPDQAFALNKPVAAGIAGQEGRRNVPSILNRRFGKSQFWDGRSETLEDQALIPIENEIELGHTVEGVLEFLSASDSYRKKFEELFDDGVTRENLAVSIATFEKSLVSGNAAIDRFQSSDSALGSKQRHGLWLYESKGGCWQCHSNSTYTDEKFHNTGVSWQQEPLDLGLFEVTEDDGDKGKFRTPTLRDVALTGPYMHDGSMATLREVVEFYNKGAGENPHLDKKIKPLNLDEEEIDSLVAFLEGLTGDHPWQSQAAKSDAENSQKSDE